LLELFEPRNSGATDIFRDFQNIIMMSPADLEKGPGER